MYVYVNGGVVLTRVKHREVRTTAQLGLVEKNRMAECVNRKYEPGESVDFFKNTVNPQRTRGVVIELWGQSLLYATRKTFR